MLEVPSQPHQLDLHGTGALPDGSEQSAVAARARPEYLNELGMVGGASY
jgi:hypothetical protein